jgi:hypothetical protein
MTKYMLMLMVLIIVTMSGSAFGQVNSNNIRINGVNWMVYGPAIITSCKAIKIYMREGESQYDVVIKDHNRLQNIKKWIMTSFGEKLNCSPVTPLGRAVVYPTDIVLYASEEMKGEDLLLLIPLSPQTLECSGKYCWDRLKETQRELKELIDKQ